LTAAGALASALLELLLHLLHFFLLLFGRQALEALYLLHLLR
jgi:hypothetical protein